MNHLASALSLAAPGCSAAATHGSNMSSTSVAMPNAALYKASATENDTWTEEVLLNKVFDSESFLRGKEGGLPVVCKTKDAAQPTAGAVTTILQKHRVRGMEDNERGGGKRVCTLCVTGRGEACRPQTMAEKEVDL